MVSSLHCLQYLHNAQNIPQSLSLYCILYHYYYYSNKINISNTRILGVTVRVSVGIYSQDSGRLSGPREWLACPDAHNDLIFPDLWVEPFFSGARLLQTFLPNMEWGQIPSNVIVDKLQFSKHNCSNTDGITILLSLVCTLSVYVQTSRNLHNYMDVQNTTYWPKNRR